MKNLVPFAFVTLLSGCQSMGLMPENMGPPSDIIDLDNRNIYRTVEHRDAESMTHIDSISAFLSETKYIQPQNFTSGLRYDTRYVSGSDVNTDTLMGQVSLETLGSTCTVGSFGTLNGETQVNYKIAIPPTVFDPNFHKISISLALAESLTPTTKPLTKCHYNRDAVQQFIKDKWLPIATPISERKRIEYAKFKAKEDARIAEEQKERAALIAKQEKERKQNAHITKMKRNGEFLGMVQFCSKEGYINRRDIPKVRKSLEADYRKEFKQPYEDKYVNQGIEDGIVKITAVAMSSHALKYDTCTETRYAVGLMKL
ncbi:hypothetical protein [Psychromonas ossibalaenae]|uniref:hypothetical protein n=1 Tax=Psychromonas ossibalaenae TaxID=444922 RepID=UPI00035CF343|nr:hypothetical protein [Psychromonas ossibalaenae]